MKLANPFAPLQRMFSQGDGSVDEAVVLGFVGMVSMVWLNYKGIVLNHQAFDPQAFGIGVGALLGGVVALMRWRSGQQPQGPTS